MIRRALTAAALVALAVLGLGLAVLVSPGTPARTTEIYLFVVAALVLASVLLGVARALPQSEPAPATPLPRSPQVGQLESISRALDQAEQSAFNVHTVLRPIVREIAASRLAVRGVALDREPERARALLGGQAWDLVRDDREAPTRGSSRAGYHRDDLRAIVESLEAI